MIQTCRFYRRSKGKKAADEKGTPGDGNIQFRRRLYCQTVTAQVCHRGKGHCQCDWPDWSATKSGAFHTEDCPRRTEVRDLACQISFPIESSRQDSVANL